MPQIAPPEQGSIVAVRQRHFVVVTIQQNTLPDDALHPQEIPHHLVTLSSIEDDAFGDELQVIWEAEPGARPAEQMRDLTPDGFDDPRRLDAFLDAVRWGAASSADMRAIQAPFRSGIVVEDYQLDPVVRAIRMPRVNLLIADDVGLGKTIEAGLVCQELLLRHRIHTLLVVCPASLQIQWRDQLRDKFGLECRIVDADYLRWLRRTRGLHVNPWTSFPRLITSFDYLKRERPLRLMSATLPGEGDSAFPRRFDLLILDEAHNVAPAGQGNYAVDSQRTQAIRRIAPHFEHKLFLSATPHNGYVNSFTALLELLDGQRFARGVPPSREQLGAVMVRRLKTELPPNWDGTPRFPRRQLEALPVPYTPSERAAFAWLRAYGVSRLKTSAPGSEGERMATEFVLKLLKKRLFSSPAAFAATLARHRASLADTHPARGAAPAPHRLQRQLERAEEDFGDEAAFEEATGDALAESARLFRAPTADEARLLDDLGDWATEAARRPDSKALALLAWLARELRPGGAWGDERAIIFTEYRDTQKWLFDLLAAEGLTAGGRVLLLYGGMTTEERERIKAAFQAHPTLDPVRILLATDAASEGIDLQNHCARLLHYEIPWNPNRMEQRNGRIDRHGQRAREVQVCHFVGAHYRRAAAALATADGDALDDDLEFLMRVAEKVEQIREDLGSVGPVIARQVEEAMLGRGQRRLVTEPVEDRARKSRELLAFERNLRERIERLMAQLRETRATQHLEPENVAAVVQIALDLAGQPPLRAATWHDATGTHPAIPVWHLPQFGGSWAQCSVGLAHPHTHQLRPIVFDESLARGRDDVVLAHLNHPLVQMALRLLRAEVWSAGDAPRLHRATARLVPDGILATPALVMHARLLVLGGDQQRLHEEVIAAGGRLREGRFARLNVGEVERALAAALPDPAPVSFGAWLAEHWPPLRPALLDALTARQDERVASIRRLLDERATQEVSDMTAILTELQASIMAQLRQPQGPQQLQLFSHDERDQYDRDADYLRQRAEAIPAEIARETVAIRHRYAHVQARCFPLAVTLLVPRGLAQTEVR
jgi:superfamily II DNA or RNA helicase